MEKETSREEGVSLYKVKEFEAFLKEHKTDAIYVRGKTEEIGHNRTRTVLVKTSKMAVKYLMRNGHGIDIEYHEYDFAGREGGYIVVENMFKIQVDFVLPHEVIIV